MNEALTDAELIAFLDETLSIEQSAEIEKLLRMDEVLLSRIHQVAQSRDQGGHTVGEIWRRARVSCFTRSQLGSYLLGVTLPDLNDYIQFHLKTIGCRFCNANLEDLKLSQRQSDETSHTRQKRYFESSAGWLRSRRDERDS